MSGFYIAKSYDENGNTVFEKVAAKPILVPGAKGLDLFIHKSPNGYYWSITEGRTGMQFSFGDTQKDAVQKARYYIKKYGIKGVVERIRSALIGKGSLSPKYLPDANNAKKTPIIAGANPPSPKLSEESLFQNVRMWKVIPKDPRHSHYCVALGLQKNSGFYPEGDERHFDSKAVADHFARMANAHMRKQKEEHNPLLLTLSGNPGKEKPPKCVHRPAHTLISHELFSVDGKRCEWARTPHPPCICNIKILKSLEDANKRWVYGTRDNEWHLVGKSDRDWGYGISQEEFRKLGRKVARERYLQPHATNPAKTFRSAKEVFGGKKKIPIEKYEAWLKTHGSKQDITGFAKAKQVAVNAGNPVKTVSLINIHPGLPGRTHLVRYGSSPEEWYHPPKGSAKAKHLKQVGAEVYKHKWKRRVPMFIDPQSGTIIKKLRPGQKADDWLRG